MKKVALWMTVAILLTSCGVQVGGHVDNVPVVKHDVKVYDAVCLNGVQYWHRGWSLAPKYSPHSVAPDTCP